MDSIFPQKLFEPPALAGGDLEYTAAFAEFMTLATPREERQVGNHVIPAQAPNWSEVLRTGTDLLEKSRDLRILAKMCRAALHKYSLPGLAQGLALMAQWLENEWDHLYPQINIDGDYDPLFRCNAIAEISDREGIVRALRQATFLETPIGTVTISAAESLLEGKSESGETVISSLDQLSRILKEESNRNAAQLNALVSISSSLALINSAFKARLESEYWPDTGLITEIISRLKRFVESQLAETEVSTQADTQASDPAAPAHTSGRATASTGPLPGALNTRAEAFKALALAREYFERLEPSHPAPLLIRRAERLADSDFLAIVKDLMPDALQQLRLLAGETGD